jgi:hypothetical protein
MAEYKKEKPKYKHAHDLEKNTTELLTELEELTHYKAQEKAQEDMGYNLQRINETEDAYFKEFYGEHKTHKGRPKTKKFKEGEEHERATDLVHHLVLDHLEHKMGKDFADSYRKNPEMIRNYLGGVGIDMNDILREIEQNPNLATLARDRDSKYNKLKSILAQSEVKELVRAEHVRNMLISNDIKHRPKVHEYFKGTTGLQVKANTHTSNILYHLREYRSNGLNQFSEKHLDENKKDFTKKSLEDYVDKEIKKGKKKK